MHILTAGLSPAFQQIMLFDDLQVDHVNRAVRTWWCASGKSTNAAIGVETLDRTGQSVLLTPLSGPGLEMMQRELAALGVRHRNVLSSVPTRVCTTLIDRKNRTVTELVENGQTLDERELERFVGTFREESESAEMLILIGSLPEGTPPDYYRRLLESRPRPIPFLCDFRGEELLHVLDLRPMLVKPNRSELETTLEKSLAEPRELFRAMRELNSRGAQWVMVSDGPKAVYLASSEEAYRFPTIPVKESEVVNPIGCGDSMSAALGWSLCRGDAAPRAVAIAIAAATVNLRELLPCRLDPRVVLSLAEKVKIEPWLGD